MSQEMRKSVIRRLNDSRFLREYFVGRGIDIGAGDDSLINYKSFFPGISNIESWDINNGDAQYLNTINDNSFDFAVSSHCLEHIMNPTIGLINWMRIIKPLGHLIITVPDEDLYEQGYWPSRYNQDHKSSFTIYKPESWSPKSINVLDLLKNHAKTQQNIKIKKIELLDQLHNYTIINVDQTRHLISESAIEIVLQKLK
jgi:predicted SAM-dependent methyltransferase